MRSRHRGPDPGSRPSARAFSLVEVVVALAVVTFCLVSMIGLLARGLQTQRESSEEVRSANLAETIINQRRAAPTNSSSVFVIPPLNALANNTNYLTAEGGPALTADQRYYRMVYTNQTNSAGLAQLYILLSTPWQAQDPTKMNTSFEIVTYVRLP